MRYRGPVRHRPSRPSPRLSLPVAPTRALYCDRTDGRVTGDRPRHACSRSSRRIPLPAGKARLRIEQRRFGDSDLTCSALGFGIWELSTTEFGAIDVGEAQRAAQEAIDHGITLFDTAESYGPRISEELLGKALGTRRKEIVQGSSMSLVGLAEGRNDEHQPPCVLCDRQIDSGMYYFRLKLNDIESPAVCSDCGNSCVAPVRPIRAVWEAAALPAPSGRRWISSDGWSIAG